MFFEFPLNKVRLPGSVFSSVLADDVDDLGAIMEMTTPLKKLRGFRDDYERLLEDFKA